MARLLSSGSTRCQAENRIQATDRMMRALELGVEKDFHVKDVVRLTDDREEPRSSSQLGAVQGLARHIGGAAHRTLSADGFLSRKLGGSSEGLILTQGARPRYVGLRPSHSGKLLGRTDLSIVCTARWK